MLLVARAAAESVGLPRPHDVDTILRATGASKSRAYEVAGTLVGHLRSSTRPPGRPPALPAPVRDDTSELTRSVLAYVMSHPGCVDRGDARQGYSDSFRIFIVGARALYPTPPLDDFARAVQVPLGTLKDWLHAPAAAAPPPVAEPARAVADTREMQLVLDAWSRWEGSFVDFCEHAQRVLRVPFGRSLLARILAVHGARSARRRPGRSPDELAQRGSFRTFFPGAQWVGDGMQVSVVVDGAPFDFNVELDVDAHTGAFVGMSVRDEEDSAAVVTAFDDGVRTTGKPPLALLLDNRPSNHTPDVDAALGDTTLRIRATAFRPQNKAHVEGAFGLFSQVAPPLVFDTSRGSREAARAFLGVVVDVWAHTTNHRPRRDRGGRSRVELYAEQPTDEQIAGARRALAETLARQERARLTLQARRRPEVLAFLDEHFARLDLLDPERHMRIAIAGYPFSAIVDGVAIFGAKRRALTLPEGVDARYLLGIVRNISSQYEAECIAEEMIKLRREVRDRLFVRLNAERDAVCANANPSHIVDSCIERALEIPPSLERSFWLEALGDFLRALPDDTRDVLALRASKRIHATYDVSPDERRAAAHAVLARAIPIA